MRKTISTIIITGVLGIIPFAPAQADAAPILTELIEFEEAVELEVYGGASVIKPCRAGTFRVRKNTRTKKKLVNSLIAGGIGAAVGGGIGGGRGALIGLGSGAGGYLIYRYVRDRKGRCVPRLVRS